MLTRAVCTLLADWDVISDYDLRVLMALVAEYDLRTYKYVSPKLISKNYKLTGRGGAILRVASSIQHLVAAGFLEVGPSIPANRAAKLNYRTGRKYATYRLNPAFALATKINVEYIKYRMRREYLMELSPLSQ